MPLPKLFPARSQAKWLLPILSWLFLSAPAAATVVVSAHPEATKLGYNIVHGEHGTAADGAIATALALNVVEPHHSGLGGGGFLLYYAAKTGTITFLDYRERTPQNLNPFFFDTRNISSQPGLTVGVPGLLRGLHDISHRWGKLPRRTLLGPVIDLARQGWPSNERAQAAILQEADWMRHNNGWDTDFLLPAEEKRSIVIKGLIPTLTTIHDHGIKPFYEGTVGHSLVDTMAAAGGVMNLADLKKYRTKTGEVVRFKVGDYEIVAPGLPSSGGIGLKHLFAIMAWKNYHKTDYQLYEYWRRLALALKFFYTFRYTHLGDGVATQDFLKDAWIDDYYRHAIRNDLARFHDFRRESPEKYPWFPLFRFETTHLNVVDDAGNIAIMTNTINSPFGSHILDEETGIILNDELNDFNVGSFHKLPNDVAPGKTPLSSMTPTLVMYQGKPLIALGSPGGPMIIANIFQVLMNHLIFGMDLEAAIAAPKLYYDLAADTFYYEQGIAGPLLARLQQAFTFKKAPKPLGNVMALWTDVAGGNVYGISDPRGEGLAMGDTRGFKKGGQEPQAFDMNRINRRIGQPSRGIHRRERLNKDLRQFEYFPGVPNVRP